MAGTTSTTLRPFPPGARCDDDVIGAVVGVPSSAGSPNPGAENGPYFIRTLMRQFTWSASEPAIHPVTDAAGILDGVVDLGDINPGTLDASGVADLVASVVERMPVDAAPCIIGGDHSITAGAIRALRGRVGGPLRVLQFDQHLDVQTWPSANGGLDDLFHTNVMSHVASIIGDGQVIQVGLAPYSTRERNGAISSLPGQATGRVPVHASAIDDDDAFGSLVGSGHPLYVTVDVDVLSASEMSATGYPAVIGLPARRLLRLLEVAVRANVLVGFDVVEFAAHRDDRDPKVLADAARAATVFLHLLSLLREQHTGRKNDDDQHRD
ncbi:arginase family protein [Curtobacterium sp. L3-7]|uniref:arginase family protein n=1 Tax=Curtobacterium sp. L3-7 TaxID=3138787 RepID=UPI003B51B10D